MPPLPPPTFKQVAPLNDTVGGVPIWAFIVVASILSIGGFLGAILYYRRVRKGRKARGETDPDFGDELRSPDPLKKKRFSGGGSGSWFRRNNRDGAGAGGEMEEDELTGVAPTMGSDEAMMAAAAAGGGGARERGGRAADRSRQARGVIVAQQEIYSAGAEGRRERGVLADQI